MQHWCGLAANSVSGFRDYGEHLQGPGFLHLLDKCLRFKEKLSNRVVSAL